MTDKQRCIILIILLVLSIGLAWLVTSAYGQAALSTYDLG
jgi:lipopolysaccharide export system protein LptC